MGLFWTKMCTLHLIIHSIQCSVPYNSSVIPEMTVCTLVIENFILCPFIALQQPLMASEHIPLATGICQALVCAFAWVTEYNVGCHPTTRHFFSLPSHLVLPLGTFLSSSHLLKPLWEINLGIYAFDPVRAGWLYICKLHLTDELFYNTKLPWYKPRTLVLASFQTHGLLLSTRYSQQWLLILAKTIFYLFPLRISLCIHLSIMYICISTFLWFSIQPR